jgi:hypothetical protein
MREVEVSVGGRQLAEHGTPMMMPSPFLTGGGDRGRLKRRRAVESA